MIPFAIATRRTYIDNWRRYVRLCLFLRVHALHDSAATIRTFRFRTYLKFAPAVNCRRALLGVLERLFALAHNPSMAYPVLRCFELQNLAARIDWLAAELAEFVRIPRDNLVSKQVTLQHITGLGLREE